MLRFGKPPYLECSSKGDKRFSAFYAKIDGDSIESLYQSAKVFQDGSTGLSWRDAKGKTPVNIEEVRTYYSLLWDYYILNDPNLSEIVKNTTGFSDIFGQEGHACQAEELYRIHRILNGEFLKDEA